MKLTAYDMAQNKEAFLRSQRRARSHSFVKIVADDEMIKDLHEMSILRVKEKYGIAVNTVRKLRAEHGVQADGKRHIESKVVPDEKMLADITTMKYDEVKAKHGISYSTITRIRKEYGILKPKLKCTREKVEYMLDLQKKGLTIAQIAEKVGMHETTAGRSMVKAKREGLGSFK